MQLILPIVRDVQDPRSPADYDPSWRPNSDVNGCYESMLQNMRYYRKRQGIRILDACDIIQKQPTTKAAATETNGRGVLAELKARRRALWNVAQRELLVPACQHT